MKLAGRIEIPLWQTASHHLGRELAAFQLAQHRLYFLPSALTDAKLGFQLRLLRVSQFFSLPLLL